MQSQTAPTMRYNVRYRFCRSKTIHFLRRNILESLKYQHSLCAIVGEGGLLAKNSLNIYKNFYFSKIFDWDQIKMFITKVAPNVGRLHYDSDWKPSFIKKNQFCLSQIFCDNLTQQQASILTLKKCKISWGSDNYCDL